jgi:hypothetical protein
MFNEQLKKEIAAIKNEIYGAQEAKPDRRGLFEAMLTGNFYKRRTLKERVDWMQDAVDKRIEKQELLLNTLLDHLKLEYHKVTDENGQTVVKHEYRPKRKGKKVLSEPSCDSDYDY